MNHGGVKFEFIHCLQKKKRFRAKETDQPILLSRYTFYNKIGTYLLLVGSIQYIGIYIKYRLNYIFPKTLSAFYFDMNYYSGVCF